MAALRVLINYFNEHKTASCHPVKHYRNSERFGLKSGTAHRIIAEGSRPDSSLQGICVNGDVAASP